MAQRKKRQTKHTPSNSRSVKFLTYITWFLAIIALILTLLVAGYYFGFKDGQTQALKTIQLEQQKRQELLKKIEATTETHSDVKKRMQAVLKQGSKPYTSASHEIEDTSLINPKKKTTPAKKVITNKPKLAIILDDVGSSRQVKAIKALHLPLTMSFLPPSSARPNSAKLAAHESFYMVHLPMEAQSFSSEEPYTLHVKDSQQKIFERIKEIKQLFPKVEYINNHTGSKFTADEVSMNRLFYAFGKEGIHFIDSRTTAETKAPQVSKNYGLEYVARDVFLDHHGEKEYVKKQIKKAVEEALKEGKAIAIGHPHKNTLQALVESKDLLKKVQLVQVKDIY